MVQRSFTKLALAIGFFALGVGTIVAYQNPATGYELSTYTETPLIFWLFSCFAVFISVLVVFSEPDRQSLLAGGFLGGVSMTAIVSLPVIRGYHYVGTEDPLSHLGTAGDINAGLMLMTENRYPVVHTVGSVLHDATGLVLTHTMLLLVVLFVVLFFVFVPLSIRELTADRQMTYIGIFSGLLLLPLNHLSPSMYIHPTSQAIMYTPAFLFTFFILYRYRSWRTSLLFVTIAPVFVLLHPQQAANLLVFFGVIAFAQILTHFYQGYQWSRYREWVLPEFTVFALSFWLWVRNLDTFWNTLETVYMIPFEETQAAETTATRSLSLSAVGGSLPEVFLKLFFVSLLFSILTAVLMFLQFSRQTGWLGTQFGGDTVKPDGGILQMNLGYVFYGLVGVGAVFLIYLIGGVSDQYFRQLGMLMVFSSILGSIMLGRFLASLSRRYSPSLGRWAVGSFLIFCLALSIPVVFASPYIYYSSDHITEMQMDGYETTFEHQSDEIAFDDIRSSASRHGAAIQGRQIPADEYYNRDETGVPDHFADRNLPGFYEEATYIPVTETDRTLDPVLWNGFRFSHEDFAYLDSEPAINRVQTNGGYDLYIVNGGD